MANMENNGYEKYIAENTSELERGMRSRVVDMATPRQEYKEGELKLDFKHRFNNGDLFVATEDRGGIARVVVERRGETVLDFSRFLPEGWKFVTPSYFLENAIELEHCHRISIGRHFVDNSRRLVSVGDLRNPQDLFAVLHEIGHVGQLPSQLPDRAYYKSAGELSAAERGAWERAIKLARKIKKEKDVDFFEPFRTFDEFKQFVYGALSSYRHTREYLNARHKLSEEDMNILRNLYKSFFDKGKFSARPTTSQASDE